jgi:cell shape-determining protein MreC
MNNLSIYAEIEVGDEVISSGVSQYFPPDMKVRIGYVESYQRNDSQTANDVVIRLATDLAKVSNVILIENYDYNEVTELENAVQNGTYSTGGAVTPY